MWIFLTYKLPSLFPPECTEKLTICIKDIGAENSHMTSTTMVDLNSLKSGDQSYYRVYDDCPGKADKTTEAKKSASILDELFPEIDPNEISVYVLKTLSHSSLYSSYKSYSCPPHDTITLDVLVDHFRAAYAGHETEIDNDSIFCYIYGILHSKDYIKIHEDAMYPLPCIPRVASFEDFKAFEEAGRKLADLHVNYEQVQPYEGCTITGLKEGFNADGFCAVGLEYGQMIKNNDIVLDKTKIIYNLIITISDIPLEAHNYRIDKFRKQSALDWLVERYGVSINTGSLQSVNDFNKKAEMVKDPKYILSLILRVITVSLETNKIMASLPALRIHPWDRNKQEYWK